MTTVRGRKREKRKKREKERKIIRKNKYSGRYQSSQMLLFIEKEINDNKYKEGKNIKVILLGKLRD